MSEDPGEDAAAMQEMMGFVSFGMQKKPEKKTKPSNSNISSNHKASGANAAPVSKRAKLDNPKSSQVSASLTPSQRPTMLVPASLLPKSKPAPPSITPILHSLTGHATTNSSPTLIRRKTKPEDHLSSSSDADMDQIVRADLAGDIARKNIGTFPLHPPDNHEPQESSTSSNPLPNSRSFRGLSSDLAKQADQSLPTPQSAYTNPQTGFSFTQVELDAFARGRRKNSQGDTVYFKPGFLQPDPWKRVREMQARQKTGVVSDT